MKRFLLLFGLFYCSSVIFGATTSALTIEQQKIKKSELVAEIEKLEYKAYFKYITCEVEFCVENGIVTQRKVVKNFEFSYLEKFLFEIVKGCGLDQLYVLIDSMRSRLTQLWCLGLSLSQEFITAQEHAELLARLNVLQEKSSFLADFVLRRGPYCGER